MKSNKLEEYQQLKEKQAHAFKECFGTPYGKETLRALKEEFYDNQLLPDDTLQFRAGQRDVIYVILSMIGEIS